MANLISLLILLLFLYGRSLCFSNNLLHRRLMLLAFACDVILVASLVMFRNALSKVGGGMPLPLLVHVPIAVLTIVLYTFTVIAGIQLAAGAPHARRRLWWLDKFLVTFRILTLVTSLWVQLSH